MPEAAEKFTPKQEAFCQSYARYSNATRAAKEAGYSEKTAHVMGHELLKKPKIIELIETIRQARFKEHHASADEVLAELGRMARSNMGEVLHITPDGDPYVDLSKASPEFLASISEATIEDFTDSREVDEQGETIKRDVRRVKVKMHSKLGALTTLAKHHGLLTEKLEVTVAEDFADVMQKARDRAREARRARDQT